MTLVAVMRFSKTSGAIVADEQGSVGMARYLSLSKLLPLDLNSGCSSIIGGSGNTKIIGELYPRLKEISDREKRWAVSERRFIKLVENKIQEIKLGYIRRFLGSEISELKTLKEEDYPDELEEFWSRYFSRKASDDLDLIEDAGTHFICLTSDSRDVYITLFGMEPRMTYQPPTKFKAIGAGDYVAEEHLLDFFESLTKEQREDVPVVSGVAALLYSYFRTARRISSVGGNPELHLIDDGKIISPTEDNTLLAYGIVRGNRKGLVPKSFTGYVLEALLYKGADYKDMESELAAELGNQRWLELNRLLRGHRI